MARGGDPYTKRKAAEKRRQWLQLQLAALYTDDEIIPRMMSEFEISHRQASRDLKTVREQSLPGKKDRKQLQEAVAHGYITSYRAALSKQGRCKNCGHAIPKPSIGTAIQTLNGIVHLWRLQVSPEELLQDDELRRQTIEALKGELPRFTPAELRVIRDECEAVLASSQAPAP